MSVGAAEEPKVGRIAAWKPIALNKDALSAHDRCFQEEWGTPRASMLTVRCFVVLARGNRLHVCVISRRSMWV